MQGGAARKVGCLGYAGVVATALILAGCGGGSQPGEASGRPIPTVHASSLSKAQFLKRADAICLEASQRAQAEYARYIRRTGVGLARSEILPHAAQIYNRFGAPIYERQVEGIRSLGAPKGDERRVTSILNAMEQGLEESGKDPVSFFFGQQSPFLKAYTLAAAYGLTKCAT